MLNVNDDRPPKLQHPSSSSSSSDVSDSSIPDLSYLNDTNCCFVIYNPAATISCTSDMQRHLNHISSSSMPTYVTLSHFETSWRSYGTDDDILFVVRQ